MKNPIKLAIFTLILTLTANIAFAQTADRMSLGDSAFQGKLYDEAIKNYSKCIELDPKSSYCYMGRGASYLELKKYQEAVNNFSKFIEIDPNHKDIFVAYSNRADAYFALKQYVKAIPDYSKAIQINPNNINLYFLRGTSYFEINDYPDAVKDFTKAIELDQKGGYYLPRSISYCRLGQTNLAKADEQKIIQLGGKVANPCTGKANQNSVNSTQSVSTQPIGSSRQPTVAELQTSKEKGKTFAKNLERLIQGKSKEEASKIVKSQVSELMKTDFYAGYSALILVKMDDVERLAIYNNSDKDVKPAMNKVRKYDIAMWQHLNEGKPKPLYPNDVPLPGTSWNKNLANNSNQTSGDSNQMSAAEKAEKIKSLEDLYSKSISKKQYPQALDNVTQLIKLDPQNSNFYSRRGMIYSFLNKHQEGIDEYSKAIELKPKGVNTYLDYTSRGELYAKIGQHEKAVDDFTKSIGLKPSEPEPFVYRAESYCKLGKIILARQDENSALAKDWQKIRNPCTAEAIQNSGSSNQNSSVANNMGFPKLPPGVFSASPKTAEDWFKLGFKQLNEKKYQSAIASYSKAIELKPDLVQAYQNRGVAYGSLNKIDLAIADFSKAIELQPKNGVYYRLRSIGYCSQDKKALARYDEAQAVELGEKIDKPCK